MQGFCAADCIANEVSGFRSPAEQQVTWWTFRGFGRRRTVILYTLHWTSIDCSAQVVGDCWYCGVIILM